MTLYGVDISNRQAGYKPGADVDFVFVKSTEGHTYTSNTHAAQVAAARGAGRVVGHYHFLWPGNVVVQANWFVNHTPLQPGDLLVCDWETTGGGLASCADKDLFLRTVKAMRPGYKVGLYCNTSDWLHVDTTSECADFLWIAAYGPKPNLQHPYLFWQYTSKPIDQNRGYFSSRAALRTWALGPTVGGAGGEGGGGPAPVKQPTPPAPAQGVIDVDEATLRQIVREESATTAGAAVQHYLGDVIPVPDRESAQSKKDDPTHTAAWFWRDTEDLANRAALSAAQAVAVAQTTLGVVRAIAARQGISPGDLASIEAAANKGAAAALQAIIDGATTTTVLETKGN